MRAAYRLSPRAKQDLAEIWAYTVARWGAEQAEDYIRQIKATLETIADKPLISRACDEIRPGYRKFSVGSHVMFMRRADEGLEVVRLLHARMDFESRLCEAEGRPALQRIHAVPNVLAFFCLAGSASSNSPRFRGAPLQVPSSCAS